MGNLPRIETAEGNPLQSRTLLFIAVPIVLLAAAGIYGHVKISADPSHATGTFLVLDHLFNLLIAAAMFALFFAVGRRLLNLCAFQWKSFAEEFVFSTAIGAGVLAFLILVVALAGMLNRLAIGIIFLAALVLCGAQLLRVVEVARTAVTRDYSRPAEIAYILAFAILVLVMVLRALAPPHAYDEGIYHLAAVKRFLEAGSLTPLYDIAQGNTHLLMNMLYAPCLMVGADSATRLLSVGFALITALSLYAYAARFFDQFVGYIAALALFGAGMIVEVAITARIDVTLAGILFLATYAMTVYLEDRLPAWLWLSAVLSGIAVGVKLTGLLWVAMLACVYLFQTLYRSSSAERILHLRRGVLYFLIVVALVSPWLLKNYAYFRDPFYPFASTETVTSQRNEPISHFGPAEDAKLESYFEKAKGRNGPLADRIGQILAKAASRRPERHPLQFWGYFTNPDVYNIGEPYHSPNYLFLVCPFFLLFGRDRRLIWLALSCVGFFVVMVLFAWPARYLVPLYPPLTLIAAFVMVRGTDWFKRRSAIGIVLPAIVLLVTTGSTVFVEASQGVKTHELNYINGSTSRVDYLSQFFYYPVLRYVNETTGRESKILMMGTQMGYDLQRPYFADTTWSSTPWRRLLLKAETPEGVRDAMKAEGITHVVYFPYLFVLSTTTGRLGFVSSGGGGAGHPDYYEQWRNWTTFEEVKAQYLEPVYQDQGFIVFTVR